MTKKEKALKKIKKDHPEFVESVDSMETGGLEDLVVNYAKELENIDEFLSENEEIKQLKEQIDEIAGPSNDAKKVCKLKLLYLVNILKDRGVTVKV